MKTIKKLILAFVLLLGISDCGNDNIKVTYYNNGVVKEEINSKENTLKEFYKDGSLKLISGYKDERLNGKIMHFYKNGVLKDSGHFVNGEPIGLAYFFNNNGVLLKIGEYLFIENEGSILNEIIYFDNNGDTIKDKGHSFKIKYINDTIKLNQQFEFSIILENSIFNDSISVVLANFDSIYYLQDSSTIQEFFGNISETKCSVQGKKIGQNRVRGIIFDFKHQPNGEIDYRSLYFSKNYYVSH